MRTRAMACLRRPVAAPGAEADGRATGSAPTEASDSLVYSDRAGSFSSRTASVV